MKSKTIKTIAILLILTLAVMLAACGGSKEEAGKGGGSGSAVKAADKACSELLKKARDEKRNEKYRAKKSGSGLPAAKADEKELAGMEEAMSLRKDFREELDHGEKGAEYQKYIVLHDTEGSGDADSVISGWLNDGRYIASQFIVNKDGTVVQCVPMDRIAHHAGFGDTGHNEKYGVTDESRDDKRGTTPIGPDHADYGMNSYSIGIEMVHVGGESYPEAQLEAVDELIAYIDAYYGKESEIIDHKMWRTGNSDTSEEFAGYLGNYRDHRTHD